jgi:hypothetical protein
MLCQARRVLPAAEDVGLVVRAHGYAHGELSANLIFITVAPPN